MAGSARRKGANMDIRKTRSLFYRAGRILGDVEAVQKAGRTHSLAPVERRVARRAVGKLFGQKVMRRI